MRRATTGHVLTALAFLLLASVSGCIQTPLPAPTRLPTPDVVVTPTAAPLSTVTPTERATPSRDATIAPTPSMLPLPSPVPGIALEPAVTGLPSSTGRTFSPTYQWEYKNVRWSFTMVIPEEVYDYFRAKPHPPGRSYASYALADEDRDTIRDVAGQLRSSGAGQGYTEYDQAMNVITFVQSLPYATDEASVETAEYPRYPVESLKDGEGDCEDKTILAAALLHEMGIDTVILLLPDHSAVGVNVVGASGTAYEYEGSRYYYAETTGGNWAVGEVPDSLKNAVPEIVALIKNPAVKLDVEAISGDAEGDFTYYSVRYSVSNTGPGTARQVALKVRALAPERGSDQIWPPERTVSLGDIAEGATVRGDVMLTIPQGELTRITCDLTGTNVDQANVRTEEFRASR